MSSWNSHHLTEEEASHINCLPTGGSDYPSDGGWIWVTQIRGGALYPLPITPSKKDLLQG